MAFFASAYPEKFARKAPLIAETFAACGAKGDVLAANGSWYWVVDEGTEKVRRADFEFLVVNEKHEPLQWSATWEGSKWEITSSSLTEELGQLDEEHALLKNSTLIGEKEAIELAVTKVAALLRKAPHLRLSGVYFTVCDDDAEIPTWRIEFKNWPIISYLNSKERSRSVTVIVDAVKKSVMAVKEE